MRIASHGPMVRACLTVSRLFVQHGAVRIDSHMSMAALSFPHLPIRGGLSFAEFSLGNL